ncbi:MAG: ribonucleoside-diphosphate reductase subunit alpha, partial [Nitrosomonas sp.]|nr:ribonucleoside-diphosphate reductase subunit alpha [Nitrosomonas sp.]
MQLATEQTHFKPVSGSQSFMDIPVQNPRFSQHKIIRRNGAVVAFEPGKISVALTKAFIAVDGGQGAASVRVREVVASLTEEVVNALLRRQPDSGTFHIEDIQDQVELALMRSGQHDVARAYVLYREERARERAKLKQKSAAETTAETLYVVDNGQRVPLDVAKLSALIESSCAGLGNTVDPALILKATVKDLYDGVSLDEVNKSLVLSARVLIEKDPAYSYVTARLLLNNVRHEVLGEEVTQQAMHTQYQEYFPAFIKRGIEAELLDPRLAQFDLKRLAEALDAERDLQFDYLGLQTLYDRYFLHVKERRIELP